MQTYYKHPGTNVSPDGYRWYQNVLDCISKCYRPSTQSKDSDTLSLILAFLLLLGVALACIWIWNKISRTSWRKLKESWNEKLLSKLFRSISKNLYLPQKRSKIIKKDQQSIKCMRNISWKSQNYLVRVGRDTWFYRIWGGKSRKTDPAASPGCWSGSWQQLGTRHIGEYWDNRNQEGKRVTIQYHIPHNTS